MRLAFLPQGRSLAFLAWPLEARGHLLELCVGEWGADLLQGGSRAVCRGRGGLASAPNPRLPSCRHLCRPCHNREKAKGLGKYICQRCHLVIDEQPLMFRNDAYHPDHFSCTHCGCVWAGGEPVGVGPPPWQ